MEDGDINVVAHAGTSAGAIVAALAAAGYRADDLVDFRAGRTIFDTRPSLAGKRPLDLIKGWGRLRLARAVVAGCASRWVRWLLIALAVVVVGALIATGAVEWLVLGLSLTVLALVAAALRGLASIEPLRQELARMFEAKLGTPDPTFADLASRGATPLKVVAANLSTRELELFSAEATPLVSVADAVIASASIPIIFHLPTIYMDRSLDRGRDGTRESDHDRFCDGGIVSNLPAWLWDEERALDPTALTVAVDISSPSRHRRVNTRGWLVPLMSTALFGSGELNLRASGRIERIRLASDLGLMEFDADREKVFGQVRSAYDAATVQITRAIIEAPELITGACGMIRQAAEEYLIDRFGQASAGQSSLIERVGFLGVERGLDRTLRLEYQVGFALRPGERPLIRRDRGAVRQAWENSALCLTRGSGAFSSDPGHVAPGTAAWRLATPLRDKLFRRVGVLVVDGSFPLDGPVVEQVASDLVEIVDSYLDSELLSILVS